MFNLLTRLFIKNRDDVTNVKVRTAYGTLCGIVGIVTNLILCTIKIVIGLLSGSISIIADGIDNLTDSGSSLVTFIAFKISSTPADANHPFGHERVEYVSGLIVSFVILLIGVLLAKNSIEKIINPVEIDLSKFVIIIIILISSMLIKLWQCFFYRKAGKKINSTALEATAMDSLNDCIATFTVLVSILICKFTGLLIDGYFGTIVAILIMINGIKLIKETISPLIGEAPSKEFVKTFEEKINSYEGVLGIHDLVIHSYGPAKIFITVHVEVDSRVNINVSHDIIDNIEHDFQKENLNVVIHMDPIDTTDEYTLDLKEKTKLILDNVHKDLHFHDFRIVKGITHTNILFDVVVPARFEINDNDLKQMIIKELKKLDPNFNIIISIDQDYVM